MRLVTICFGAAISVAIIGLVVVFASQRSASVGESRRQAAVPPQRISSEEVKLDGSTGVISARSLAEDSASTLPENGPSDKPVSDEEEVRKSRRQRATSEVLETYALLIDQLVLTREKRDALVSLLVELKLASGTAYYTTPQGKSILLSRGRSISQQERSERIAAVIGDSKRKQFIELQENLGAYTETQKIQSMLQLNGVPFSDKERDGFLKLLITARDQYPVAQQRSEVKPGSLESLDAAVNELDEYERRVLELAPSVLSSKQVQYLFEQYQYRAESRASAVEMQKKRKADNPSDKLPLWYPAT